MENSFLDTIISKDKELLIYLNNLGTEQWDAMWLAITNQFYWSPLLVFLIYLIFKKLGTKQGLFTFFFLVFLIAFSDNFTNFIKDSFMRLRPNNDPLMQDKLRHLLNPQSYSFWSGHASGSTTFTTFVILLLRPFTKKIYWLLLFPLIFSYSRLYLGVHYPIDIVTGILSGIAVGSVMYWFYNVIYSRFFKS